jgi:hypothetical protein
MKKLGIAALTGLLGLALVSGVFAQPGMGQGRGQGPGDPSSRMYNPAAVETVSGTVESVVQTPGKGASNGMHFTLKTDKETIPVHLGPAWYMDKQEVKPAAGDKVEVTGSRVTYEGKPAIIAGQVKKDGKMLNLRDANGVPAWAGKGAGKNRR